MNKDLMIRSSVQEFITFKMQEKDKGIQVRYKNENLWMTQKGVAELFDDQRPTITKHLINIFNDNELDKSSVCSKMEHTAEDRNYNEINVKPYDLVEYHLRDLNLCFFGDFENYNLSLNLKK